MHWPPSTIIECCIYELKVKSTSENFISAVCYLTLYIDRYNTINNIMIINVVFSLIIDVTFECKFKKIIDHRLAYAEHTQCSQIYRLLSRVFANVAISPNIYFLSSFWICFFSIFFLLIFQRIFLWVHAFFTFFFVLMFQLLNRIRDRKNLIFS